jgi:DNA-binding winged helix-turn-helix (wHTH) protein
MFIQARQQVYTTRTLGTAMSASEQQRVVRFGVFTFDPRAGELLKLGRKLKIQGQPVEILAMLLERPGEIVTREEFQKRLWPDNTFVDFEHSLNAAVKRLRDAMGDSADAPQYVETLARRGYRFIAVIEPQEQPNEKPAAETQVGQSNWPLRANFLDYARGLGHSWVAQSCLPPCLPAAFTFVRNNPTA